MAKESEKAEKEDAAESAKEEKKEAAEGDAGTEGEGEEGLHPPKKKISKKLLLILAGGAFVLLLGGGAALYFLGVFGADETPAEHEEGAHGEAAHGEKAAHTGGDEAAHGEEGNEEEAEEAHGIAPIFFPLGEVLVNLSGDGKRPNFLKIKVNLELADEKDVPSVEGLKPRIIDHFQVYLRELRIEDLRGSAGLHRLREELLLRVTETVKPIRVRDVLFQEMLVQ